jgi:NhaP-type Na+/H+ or K+/H+ antiporter
MVVIGSVASFVPGFEAPELDSHILLTVVLPPLLYSSALDFSFPTFLRNIRPILGLGVGLVVVTAFTVAAVSNWLGFVTLWIRKRLANPGLETVQGLVVPFAAFIAAEELHASGVLAVVVAGFVVGNGPLGAGYQTRLPERYVWNSIDVLLEAFVRLHRAAPALRAR